MAAPRPRIGAHVSAAGGLKKLLERADALKVEALQLHPSAPQSYRQPVIDEAEAEQFRAAIKERGWPVVFHSIYLLNLAAPDDRLWHASIGSLAKYLLDAPKLASLGTVTHLGSHKGAGLPAVQERLEHAAKKLGAAIKGQPAGKLIIENTAGGGGTLGRDLAELETLFRIFSQELPTAICLDSCHLFAAGVDLTDANVWAAWRDDFGRRIGWEHVVAIHLNDSKFPLGSKRDRHANLGDGEIGLEALGRLINDPILKDVAFILEVPGEGKGPDAINIERAKSLRH